MKKKLILVFSALLIIAAGAYYFFSASGNDELEAVRNMAIEDINPEDINDGVYRGSFSYGSFDYEVEVSVEEHRIIRIDAIKNRDTKYAKKAEGVFDRVLEKQSPNVDVVSGASTTSKALLKAIENALKAGR